MTDHCDSCPFAGCEDCAYPGGAVPHPDTGVSAGQNGCEGGKLTGSAQTRETPASAATDRGRGPTNEESNVNDRTPALAPVTMVRGT